MLTLIIGPLFVWYWLEVASFHSGEEGTPPGTLWAAGGAMLTIIVGCALLWVLNEVALFPY